MLLNDGWLRQAMTCQAVVNISAHHVQPGKSGLPYAQGAVDGRPSNSAHALPCSRGAIDPVTQQGRIRRKAGRGRGRWSTAEGLHRLAPSPCAASRASVEQGTSGGQGETGVGSIPTWAAQEPTAVYDARRVTHVRSCFPLPSSLAPKTHSTIASVAM